MIIPFGNDHLDQIGITHHHHRNPQLGQDGLNVGTRRAPEGGATDNLVPSYRKNLGSGKT